MRPYEQLPDQSDLNDVTVASKPAVQTSQKTPDVVFLTCVPGLTRDLRPEPEQCTSTRTTDDTSKQCC